MNPPIEAQILFLDKLTSSATRQSAYKILSKYLVVFARSFGSGCGGVCVGGGGGVIFCLFTCLDTVLTSFVGLIARCRNTHG